MIELKELPDLDLPPGYRIQKEIPTLAALNASTFPIRMPNAPEYASSTVRVIACDYETSGLNIDVDEPIEIGLVDMTVCADSGMPICINGVLNQLNEPSKPIPAEVTEVTGLTDKDVAGHRFDFQKIEDFVRDGQDKCPIMVAHNTEFDREWFEMMFPQFSDLPWACTLNEIPWEIFHVDSKKQTALLAHFGYYYDAHRATVDCLALCWLNALAPEWFKTIYDIAYEPTFVIKAFEFPIRHKDILKHKLKFTWDGSVWHKKVKGYPALNERHGLLENLYLELNLEPACIQAIEVERPRQVF